MNDLHAVFRTAPVYAIFDTQTHLDIPPGEIFASWLRAGIRVIQYRHKEPWTRANFAECEELAKAVGQAGSIFIVDDRSDVALLCGAAGVHVGQEDLSPEAVRKVLGNSSIIGYSTHSTLQVDLALAKPIDYVAVGPVYSTASKASPDPVVGIELVKASRLKSTLPLVAIGGITMATVKDVMSAGADAVAVISGLVAGCHSTDDLEARAKKFLAAAMA